MQATALFGHGQLADTFADILGKDPIWSAGLQVAGRTRGNQAREAYPRIEGSTIRALKSAMSAVPGDDYAAEIGALKKANRLLRWGWWVGLERKGPEERARFVQNLYDIASASRDVAEVAERHGVRSPMEVLSADPARIREAAASAPAEVREKTEIVARLLEGPMVGALRAVTSAKMGDDFAAELVALDYVNLRLRTLAASGRKPLAGAELDKVVANLYSIAEAARDLDDTAQRLSQPNPALVAGKRGRSAQVPQELRDKLQALASLAADQKDVDGTSPAALFDKRGLGSSNHIDTLIGGAASSLALALLMTGPSAAYFNPLHFPELIRWSLVGVGFTAIVRQLVQMGVAKALVSNPDSSVLKTLRHVNFRMADVLSGISAAVGLYGGGYLILTRPLDSLLPLVGAAGLLNVAGTTVWIASQLRTEVWRSPGNRLHALAEHPAEIDRQQQLRRRALIILWTATVLGAAAQVSYGIWGYNPNDKNKNNAPPAPGTPTPTPPPTATIPGTPPSGQPTTPVQPPTTTPPGPTQPTHRTVRVGDNGLNTLTAIARAYQFFYLSEAQRIDPTLSRATRTLLSLTKLYAVNRQFDPKLEGNGLTPGRTEEGKRDPDLIFRGEEIVVVA